MRPGRLDRKIEFPNPDRRQKRMVSCSISNIDINIDSNVADINYKLESDTKILIILLIGFYFSISMYFNPTTTPPPTPTPPPPTTTTTILAIGFWCLYI